MNETNRSVIRRKLLTAIVAGSLLVSVGTEAQNPGAGPQGAADQGMQQMGLTDAQVNQIVDLAQRQAVQKYLEGLTTNIKKTSTPEVEPAEGSEMGAAVVNSAPDWRDTNGSPVSLPTVEGLVLVQQMAVKQLTNARVDANKVQDMSPNEKRKLIGQLKQQAANVDSKFQAFQAVQDKMTSLSVTEKGIREKYGQFTNQAAQLDERSKLETAQGQTELAEKDRAEAARIRSELSGGLYQQFVNARDQYYQALAANPLLGVQVPGESGPFYQTVLQNTDIALVPKIHDAATQLANQYTDQIDRISQMDTTEALWELAGSQYGLAKAMAAASGGGATQQLIDALEATYAGTKGVADFQKALEDTAISMGQALPGAGLAFTAISIYRDGNDYVVTLSDEKNAQAMAPAMGYQGVIDTGQRRGDAGTKLAWNVALSAPQIPGLISALKSGKNLKLVSKVKGKTATVGGEANAAKGAETGAINEAKTGPGEVGRPAENAAAVTGPKPPRDSAIRNQAIEDSGMAPRHAEAASQVAQKRDEFILMGATNKAATEPNDLGYLSKDMHVKGKSAAGGPNGQPTFYDGMIPINQSLSKAGGAPSAPDLVNYGGPQGVIDHFNGEVQKTLDMPPYKMEFTRADGSKAQAMVSYQKMEVAGPNGQKVAVLGKKMEFLGANGKPNGTVVEGPIVADYDMITIGTKNPAMTQLPDPHLGNVNQQARGTIEDMNAAMGRSLNPGVHHGAQGAAPINPGIPYPVTAFGPDGRVVTIPKASGLDPDLNLKSFYDQMEAKGYHAEVNQDWGWQRGSDGKWSSGETIEPLARQPSGTDAATKPATGNGNPVRVEGNSIPGGANAIANPGAASNSDDGLRGSGTGRVIGRGSSASTNNLRNRDKSTTPELDKLGKALAEDMDKTGPPGGANSEPSQSEPWPNPVTPKNNPSGNNSTGFLRPMNPALGGLHSNRPGTGMGSLTIEPNGTLVITPSGSSTSYPGTFGPGGQIFVYPPGTSLTGLTPGEVNNLNPIFTAPQSPVPTSGAITGPDGATTYDIPITFPDSSTIPDGSNPPSDTGADMGRNGSNNSTSSAGLVFTHSSTKGNKSVMTGGGASSSSLGAFPGTAYVPQPPNGPLFEFGESESSSPNLETPTIPPYNTGGGGVDSCLVGTWRSISVESPPIVVRATRTIIGGDYTQRGGAGIVLKVEEDGAETVDYSGMEPLKTPASGIVNQWNGTASGKITAENGRAAVISVEHSNLTLKSTRNGATQTSVMKGLGPASLGENTPDPSYTCDETTLKFKILNLTLTFKREGGATREKKP